MISKHSRNIASSFIIILGLLLAMIIFGLSRMSIMQSKLDVIIKEHSVKARLMMEMRHGIYERQVSLRNIMLMQDPFDRDEGKMLFNSYALNIVLARNKFTNMPLSEQERKILTEINSAMVSAYIAQTGLIEASIYDDKEIVTEKEILKTFDAQKLFISKINEMVKLQDRASEKAVQDAEESYSAAKSSVYILGGSALLLGIFVALFIIRLTESQAKNVSNAISELENSQELLEYRVQIRTEELAHARDEALASNRAKDVFLANMSHELRTPLNIILGYSELLGEIAEENNCKSMTPDLNKINKAALHQLELINSILDISKIEEGRLEINAIDFDVEMLISEVEEAAKPLMSKNNNTFEIKCAYGIGMMYSDNMRIRQILLNLLSNAAKFTEKGLVVLTVSKNDEKGRIQFKVEDNGVGIAESYMDDLFEKFTQADSSTTRLFGGTGLGLSISKQLSHLLKGEISVASKDGKGACFTLTLPIIFIE